jgi:hypothetical protein
LQIVCAAIALLGPRSAKEGSWPQAIDGTIFATPVGRHGQHSKEIAHRRCTNTLHVASEGIKTRYQDMAQSQIFEAAAPLSGETEITSVRWMQLVMGFIVMMTISSPQYVWTLFVPSF